VHPAETARITVAAPHFIPTRRLPELRDGFATVDIDEPRPFVPTEIFCRGGVTKRNGAGSENADLPNCIAAREPRARRKPHASGPRPRRDVRYRFVIDMASLKYA